MSYKSYFSEKDKAVFQKRSFLKRYGTLYGLLEDLITRKVNIDNANVDLLNIIINSLHGYNKNDLFDKKIQIKKSNSLKNEPLKKTRIIFYNAKMNPEKRIKIFFPNRFKKRHFRGPKKCFIKSSETIRWQK